MQRVIVCIRTSAAAPGRDLEVPAEVPSGELAAMLSLALRKPTLEADGHARYGLAILPSGKELSPNQSLADAGVWDGARLLLVEREHATPVEVKGPYLESDQGMRYALAGREVWIGRVTRGEVDGETTWIDLTHEPGGDTVSHQHAVLSRDGEGWRLALSGQARNLSYVNGEQIAAGRTVALREGDLLEFGAMRLRFHEPAS